MHLLSTLISRQREILADAAAVELCRTPKALARSIYKAHMRNSFIGDFNQTYNPLYIVPPESKGITDGFFSRLFNTHPPLMNRIEKLAVMANTSSSCIIAEIHDIQKRRATARTILDSGEDRRSFSKDPAPEERSPEEKIWAIRSPKGKWLGPLNLEETLYHKTFTPLIRTMNIPEGIEAPAREFPQIQFALRHLWHKRPVRASRQNRCPRCRISFHDVFYEGVSVKQCPECQGNLVDSKSMNRVIARKETGFSKKLQEKAEAFRSRFMFNPVRTIKINAGKSPVIYCPSCGSKMLPRPYSYHYVVPVDKCFHCGKIWFDMDELEILQILIEDR
jgi:Zn-finger nucleic acid-binding protein